MPPGLRLAMALTISRDKTEHGGPHLKGGALDLTLRAKKWRNSGVAVAPVCLALQGRSGPMP
jgi:hypothetical protein